MARLDEVFRGDSRRRVAGGGLDAFALAIPPAGRATLPVGGAWARLAAPVPQGASGGTTTEAWAKTDMIKQTDMTTPWSGPPFLEWTFWGYGMAPLARLPNPSFWGYGMAPLARLPNPTFWGYTFLGNF